MGKLIQQNKKAYFDFFIEETYEAGVVLEGMEVKSVIGGRVNLKDSYCDVSAGEIFLKNCHISSYEKTGAFFVDERRPRKLLLHKSEINRLSGKVREKGFTLVPTKIYIENSKVKVEIGLAKGKHTYDKRATLKEKESKRQIEREIKGR